MYDQAELKATAIVQRASTHMSLEKQSLTEQQNKEEINRNAKDFADDMPADLWDQD